MCFKAFRHPAYQMPASFRGTGCTIGSVSILTIYNKMGRSRLQMKSKAGSIPVATFSLLLFKSLGKMLRGGWANSFIKNKEGTAVGFLLVWCG
jgi:hypothetical protein